MRAHRLVGTMDPDFVRGCRIAARSLTFAVPTLGTPKPSDGGPPVRIRLMSRIGLTRSMGSRGSLSSIVESGRIGYRKAMAKAAIAPLTRSFSVAFVSALRVQLIAVVPWAPNLRLRAARQGKPAYL